MKKTILAIIVLISVNSSFAATGKGYRILGEELHSAPGFNFHVEEVQPKTATSLKKLNDSHLVYRSGITCQYEC